MLPQRVQQTCVGCFTLSVHTKKENICLSLSLQLALLLSGQHTIGLVSLTYRCKQ